MKSDDARPGDGKTHTGRDRLQRNLLVPAHHGGHILRAVELTATPEKYSFGCILGYRVHLSIDT